VGSTNLHHIQENIRHLENGPLPEAIVSAIRAAFEQTGESWPGQI
jgi:aryl-alcohol dehydrogenase-like predicted oxidoreductase